jgi:hypothetical protein
MLIQVPRRCRDCAARRRDSTCSTATCVHLDWFAACTSTCGRRMDGARGLEAVHHGTGIRAVLQVVAYYRCASALFCGGRWRARRVPGVAVPPLIPTVNEVVCRGRRPWRAAPIAQLEGAHRGLPAARDFRHAVELPSDPGRQRYLGAAPLDVDVVLPLLQASWRGRSVQLLEWWLPRRSGVLVRRRDGQS